ncbi:MAG: DUF7669 domain-containing protein, partial [Gemmatimonadota bacterium]
MGSDVIQTGQLGVAIREERMPIFKLDKTGPDLSSATLVEASKTNLDLEKHLECWLERSPWAIAQEPIIWIGRQTTALVEDTHIFPDLLGMDREGNLVIIELKKGRAPREVVAQLLEYAAWASDLSDDMIHEFAFAYFTKSAETKNKELVGVFLDTFEADDLPSLNQRQRLYVVAEDIPLGVARVCRFLRMSHGIDINCIAFSVYQTESGEMLVSSEYVVGREDVSAPKSISKRWSGAKPVRQVVWEAVQEVTSGDKGYIFSPKEITKAVLKKYPDFNKSTVGCQIISDCVGHTSRHHYPGGEDRYWWVDKGKYR